MIAVAVIALGVSQILGALALRQHIKSHSVAETAPRVRIVSSVDSAYLQALSRRIAKEIVLDQRRRGVPSSERIR